MHFFFPERCQVIIPFLEKNILSVLSCLCSFDLIMWLYTCGSISGLTVLFHWSFCLHFFAHIISLTCLWISTDISSNLISYSTLSNLIFVLFIVFLILIIIIFILRCSTKFFFQICLVIPDSLLLLIITVILSFISTNILYHFIPYI